MGLGVKMYNGSDFTKTYTSAFLLEVIGLVPFMLGSWNLVCYLHSPKPSTVLELPQGHAQGWWQESKRQAILCTLDTCLVCSRFPCVHINNLLSESIYIWTTGTLGWVGRQLSFHDTDPRGFTPGWAKSRTPVKSVFFFFFFSTFLLWKQLRQILGQTSLNLVRLT